MALRGCCGWIAVCVAACGGSTSTTGRVDAGTDATSDAPAADAGSCADRFFAAIDKSCAADGDCATFNHDDCCGTTVIGIRAGTTSAASTAEQGFLACETGCMGRGCFHADMAEDGRSVLQGDGGAIVVTCVAGRCMTRVP